MGRLRIFGARMRGLFRKRQLDGDLDAELRAHLEMLTEENIRKGMPPEEARYAARREFGGVEQSKELHREQRSIPFLDALFQDLRFALRGLRNRPGFALVAILTLSLGIGSTTAVFSVVDRILFRSLPYPHDEELVSFGDRAPFEANEFVLGPDYVDWKKGQTPFLSVTSFVPGGADCDLTEKNPVRLKCALVESTFLPTFEIQPFLGRNFTSEEDRPHAPRVALVSYGLWRSRFASDRNLPGRTISLDGKPTVVVGVLPPQFEMPNLGHDDLLVPAALDGSTDRNARQVILRAFARLKPGITIKQAAAAMEPLYQQSLNYVPPQFRKEVSFRVRSLRDRQIQDARVASWVLLGAVLAVLLVACTNVANLLLARATSRARELAVRTALGATRGRLIRQALTESLLLGVLGGLAGCWFAQFLLRLFVSIAPEGIPRLEQAAIDVRVLLFALGVSLLAGVLFGLASALRRPVPELLTGKENRATSRGVLRQLLVTVQIAVSLILLAGAGLLLRSLWKLETVALGMDAKSAITAGIDLTEYRYPDSAKQLAFFDQVEARLKQMPGVASLALSDSLPPSGGRQATFLSAIEIPGHTKFSAGTGGMIGYRYVTPAYFPALGVPIVRGRGFREEDRLPAEKPVILSEALANKLFSNGEDPIGKSFRFGLQNDWRTIVGIAGDVKNNGLAAPADPEFYIPWKNESAGYFRSGHLIVQSAINPEAIAKWIRTETAAIDPTVPVTIEGMNTRVGKLAERPRFTAVLLSLFAAMGVLLAGIGIYGVVGFLVAQQTREIGIRIALGATPASVLRMVLSNMVRWTATGAALGLLGAWLCSRLLESLLFEVRAHDPFLLGAALLVLLAVAFLAAWIPARRAMRVDPMVALRYE
ncbi:MAG TPA: ABC transporter permease [Candidatus Acidoferrales bacterium]|nr:ABC transporter permease [Candidatus Acidoferrales bacterium]